MERSVSRIRPRFSDFNLQGLLKGSLHFDFVCEAQLDAIGTRYGIEFAKYARAGQKWNITDYGISFHEENRSLKEFLVSAEITRLDGSDMEVSFSFWDGEKTARYASRTILFRLFDTEQKRYVSIDDDDLKAFAAGGALAVSPL